MCDSDREASAAQELVRTLLDDPQPRRSDHAWADHPDHTTPSLQPASALICLVLPEVGDMPKHLPSSEDVVSALSDE